MSYDSRHHTFEGLFKNDTFTSLSDAALLWTCHTIIKWPFKYIYRDRNRPVILDRYESLQIHLHCKNEHFYLNFTSLQTPQLNSLLKCYGSHVHFLQIILIGKEYPPKSPIPLHQLFSSF